MMRERSRGSKLGGAFKKRKEFLLENSNHTFLTAGRNQKTIFSKRDIGQMREEQPCCSKWFKQRDKPQEEGRTNEQKEAENNYMPFENEMPHENEVTEQEIPNQNEAINKEPMKGKNAIEKMRKLKKKAKRQQKKDKLRKENEWLKQLETVFSESEEEEINSGEMTNTDKEEGKEETENQEEQKQSTTRREERARKKPEFFGHNVMVSQLSPSGGETKQ